MQASGLRAPGLKVLWFAAHSMQVVWPSDGWKKLVGQGAHGSNPVSE